jgi:inhibitor of cysteine peptidase
MMRSLTLSLLLALFALVLAACGRTGPGGLAATPTIDQAKLANPAAGYCRDQGFTYETRQDARGNETGVCIFDDGSECDAWAYLRGECGQEKLGKLSVNLVEQAGLQATESIEVLVPTTPLVAFDVARPNQTAEMKPLLTVTDRAQIDALIDALNRPANLIPPTRCPIGYELRFVTPQGTERFQLGVCGLIGDQDYLRGMILPLPEAFISTFNALVQP